MIVVQIGNRTPTRCYAQPYGYAEPIVHVARCVPGLAWEPGSKSYEGWPDAVAAFAEALTTATPQPLAAIVGSIDMPDRAERPTFLPAKIREYQVEGVKFLRQLAPNGGALLADDPGNGKTVQALVAARSLIETDGLSPVVVVICPAYIKPVWAAEAEKWTGSFFDVMSLEGVKAVDATWSVRTAQNPLLIVLNYDIAHAWARWLTKAGIGVLICDEAHALMNERSRRSVAVKEIATAAQARMLLTGTPMTARPRDLWNPLDTLTPGRWGKNPWKFLHRHCAAHKETVAKNTTVWITDGSSNIPELSARLRFVMLRRTKADVMKELPALVRQIIPVKVPQKNIMPIWKEGWGKRRRDTLARALTLSGAGKVGVASELVTDRVAEGQSCVVFTHLRETASRIGKSIGKALAKEKVAVEVLTGDDSVEVRTETVARLRKMSALKPVVIVATIDSMGMGIDLSYMGCVVFVDLDWVPAKLIQAESRAHRHGAKGTITIYYLVGIGTADEYVQKKVIERLDLYAKVVGGQEAEELRDNLQGSEQMSEDEVLADLRRMIEAGEVLSEEMEAA